MHVVDWSDCNATGTGRDPDGADTVNTSCE